MRTALRTRIRLLCRRRAFRMRQSRPCDDEGQITTVALGRKSQLTGLDYLIGAADHLAAQGRNVGPMLYRDLLAIYALGGQGLASTGQAEDYALSEFDHVDQAALACVNEAVTLAVKRKDHNALAEIARTAVMVSLRWRGFAERRAEE